MSRKVVRIVPNGGKGWNVKVGNQTVSHHNKKSNAVQTGRQIAKKKQPSQLVVHNQNGQFQTEHTYKNDPHPPEG